MGESVLRSGTLARPWPGPRQVVLAGDTV